MYLRYNKTGPMDGIDRDTELEALKFENKRLRAVLKRLAPTLPVMLKRRGFQIYKKEPAGDLLIPGEKFLDGYYETLKKYSFRLFLRDVIKHQPLFTTAQVARYATREVTEEYTGYLQKIGLVLPEDGAYRLLKAPIKSFGETLEWFVAEIFKREFSVEALWGVKVKRRTIGGDYDLLAKIDGSILYMETKSSPPKQIYQREIRAFFERVDDLSPGIAIFFVDTELRMKDKIVPMFEEELRDRLIEPPEMRRIEKELFVLEDTGSEGPRIFIINAKDSIINNIERVLMDYFRRIG